MRFQDINLSFAQRLASAMQEGHDKYEEGLMEWDKDYLHQSQDQALTRVNNAIKHLLKLNDFYLSKLRGLPVEIVEDDLGHCAANLNMLAEWERRGVLPSSITSPVKDKPVHMPHFVGRGLHGGWICRNCGVPGPNTAECLTTASVSDEEEALWRAQCDSETDIAARIAARGKASSPEDRKAVINGTCQGCGREAHLEDGTVRHEKPYRGTECVFEGRAL